MLDISCLADTCNKKWLENYVWYWRGAEMHDWGTVWRDVIRLWASDEGAWADNGEDKHEEDVM